MPRNPGVQPFPDRPKRKNLRAKSCRLKLVCEMAREGLREPGVLGEMRTHGSSRDGKGARRHDSHAVAVVALGKDGSFGENRVRTGTLQDERPPVRAVTDEVRFTRDHKVEHRDLVAAAEEKGA